MACPNSVATCEASLMAKAVPNINAMPESNSRKPLDPAFDPPALAPTLERDARDVFNRAREATLRAFSLATVVSDASKRHGLPALLGAMTEEQRGTVQAMLQLVQGAADLTSKPLPPVYDTPQA